MKKYILLLFTLIIVFCCVGLKMGTRQMIIYIDPGHGGIDGGCIGCDGTYEKDINLNISLELRNALINLGYMVEMTRVGDYDLASSGATNRKREDILKRCELMSKGDLFISIHCNSYPDSSIYGAQVFYSDEEEKALSIAIQKSIKDMFNNTNREAHRITNKYILENIDLIGCIVEVGFLSNRNDLSQLKNLEYQRNISYAIAIGINEFITSNL